jgi:signal transduction histidine kinase/CheY-like chemotaxis protein
VAVSATFAAAVILVPVFWSVTPHSRLLGWLTVYLLTTVLRLVLILYYRRATAEDRSHGHWLHWSLAGIAASGLTWGATIPLLPPPDSLVYQGFATLWVCGLAAGSVAALSAVRGAFFAFLLPATLPGAIYLLAAETPVGGTVGGALLMFVAFLSLNAVRMHKTVTDSLRLQFENGDLIADLAAEKQHIQELNAELESRVVERTADLNAAIEAKSRFLAAASHDLRQPLQMLSLLQESLAATLGESNARQIVADMGEGLRVTGGLLDALTDIAQLDRRGLKPKIGDFPIAEALDRLGTEFGPAAREKGLKLHIVRSTGVVRSDKGLLERILRNLLSNAIRYTSSGKVLVGCRRRGTSLGIEVWDTGTGIPPEDIGRVFEEFYRVEGPTGDHRTGQGLGLAIVERTARLLGHPVRVRSTLGRGSVFTLEAPLVGSARIRSEQATLAEPARDVAAGPRILLIDDDEDVLDATRLLLGLQGFRVVAERTGSAALNECERHAEWPDLVIADYRLSNAETALAVVKRLRSTAGREIPALILTGDASAESDQEIHASACRLLRKPVQPDELIRSIRELVHMRPTTHALRANSTAVGFGE